MVSTAHGTWSMGPLGAFWPKSNEVKRGKGGQPPALKARWTHLSQFWPPISTFPKMAKMDPRTKIGQELRFGHFSTSGLWKQPAQVQQDFP
ncbi:hypothetical protein O181_084016 [Austropuccinia psidii MF-1]|uniref:Uncharacterized protein n=1 Tax=Austropuccinia psidii MF-1 TaxID=1389203 RepID=A0A9Q3IIF6_9BASI|nr:hypothetical protein [Austropuccinia psidii MF-1]